MNQESLAFSDGSVNAMIIGNVNANREAIIQRSLIWTIIAGYRWTL